MLDSGSDVNQLTSEHGPHVSLSVSWGHSLSCPQHSEALGGQGGQETTSLWAQASQQAVLPRKGPCFVVHGWHLATWQLTHSHYRAINS